MFLSILLIAGVVVCMDSANGQFVSLQIGTSPNPVGSGARALGQGNAFIAVADDATSASWNPGGLTQLERPEISFAVERIIRHEATDSTTEPEIQTAGSLSLSDLNYASIVYPIYYKRHMVLSLNFLKVYGFDKSLAFPLSQTSGPINVDYEVDFDQDGEFSVIAPAFAIDVTSKLALGVTFNIWDASSVNPSRYTKHSSYVGIADWTSVGKAQFTQISHDEFEVNEGRSFVLGGMYRLSKAFTLAGVLKPAYKLDIKNANTFTYLQTGDLGTISVVGNKTEKDIELRLPWIIGAGLAWRPNDPLTVSMDVTWTEWSDYASKDLQTGVKSNPITGTPFGLDPSTGLAFPPDKTHRTRLDETFTYRLGCEYLFILEDLLIPLRCGAGYDPGPVVNAHDDFYSITVGAGIQIKERVNLDFAYEHRWGNDVNGDTLIGVNGSQDIRQHRFLASMICYF